MDSKPNLLLPFGSCSFWLSKKKAFHLRHLTKLLTFSSRHLRYCWLLGIGIFLSEKLKLTFSITVVVSFVKNSARPVGTESSKYV